MVVAVWEPADVASFITAPPPSLLLFAATSLNGWGAHLQELTAAGEWLDRELGKHINILELRAVLIALTAFLKKIFGQSIVLMSDILQ